MSFANTHGVTVSSQRVYDNPNMSREGKPWGADHWKVTLRCQRRQLTTYFSKGYGHGGAAPTADEVLDCLASDAGGYYCDGSGAPPRSFEDWCGDYGYDTDSRTAERTYNVIGKHAAKLKRLLGELLYDELLYHTERM